MKPRIILLAALLVASFDAGAQGLSKKHYSCKIVPPFNRPHFSTRPGNKSATITFDATSTTLTVKFPSNSQGGTVEVYRNGAKVADITTNGGTTFSCRLREYGTGNYNVIVSNGNTVVDSKNYTVR
jgi:hypothetical protein